MSTALVTGASAGLGLTFARQLAKQGYSIVLVARDSSRLEEVAAELRANHRIQTEVMPADLADRADTARVAERVASTTQPVELLVNNAGFGRDVEFLSEAALEHEERSIDVMIRSVLVLSHAAARAMVSRGHGQIINVSSIAAYGPLGPYSAIKAWVSFFTEGLAATLASTGVTATAVCPGFTHTEFHKRAGINTSGLAPEFAWLEADDVVREALHDASRGKVVSVPSVTYKVLAGVMSAIPRPLLRRALRFQRPKSTPR